MQISEDIIRNLAPFHELSTSRIQEIITRLSYEEIADGHHLFHAGDWDNQTIFLVTGEIALWTNKKDQEIISAKSKQARYAIADAQPRKMSAKAFKDVTILRVDSALLNVLLSQNNAKNYQVAEIAAADESDWMTQVLQSKVFRNIPADNIMQVIMCMEQVDVRAGDIIINQGDEGDYFYIINSGRCQVRRVMRPNTPVVTLAELGAGDSFGEEALVSGLTRNTTITMLTDGRLHRLDKNQFIHLVKNSLLEQITYRDAVAAVKDGAVLVDFRDHVSYQNASLKDSINVPFFLLRSQLEQLDKSRKYITYCDDGSVSAAAAFYMTQEGFDAAALRSGMKAIPENDLEQKSPNYDSSGNITLTATLKPSTPVTEQEDDSAKTSTPTCIGSANIDAGAAHIQPQAYQNSAELLKLKQEIAELNDALAISSENLTAAQGQRDKITDQFKHEREKQYHNVTLFRRQIERLEKERDDFRSKFETAVSANNAATANTKDPVTDNGDAQTAQIAALQQQQVEQTKVLEQARQKHAVLEKRISELSAENATIKNNPDNTSATTTELQKLTTRLNEHKEHLRKVLNAKIALEKALKAYKEREKISQLKNQKEIDQLKNELDQAKQQQSQQLDNQTNGENIQPAQFILGKILKREDKQAVIIASQATDGAANIRHNLAELRKEMDNETIVHQKRMEQMLKLQEKQMCALKTVLADSGETTPQARSIAEKVSKKFLWGIILLLLAVVMGTVFLVGNL